MVKRVFKKRKLRIKKTRGRKYIRRTGRRRPLKVSIKKLSRKVNKLAKKEKKWQEYVDADYDYVANTKNHNGLIWSRADASWINILKIPQGTGK